MKSSKILQNSGPELRFRLHFPVACVAPGFDMERAVMWSPVSAVVLAFRFVPTLGPANAVGLPRCCLVLWSGRKVMKSDLVSTAKTAVLRLQQFPIRPVLKHGPRSLACARVFGWQTQRRNESKYYWDPVSAGAPVYRYSCIAKLADSERIR